MKRNKFNLSHYKLLSCDMGRLIPINVTEILPGDTIQQATSLFIRLSPLLAPVMHPVQARVHHFFVPYRLIWEDFQDFITGGRDGLNASVPPYRSLDTSLLTGTLWDYLGIPPDSGTHDVSVLPLRAYMTIYNEFFRDPGITAEVPVSLASGVDSSTYVQTLACAWERDYFTTARPFEELGPSVSLPWDGAPVVSTAGVGASGRIRVASTDNLAGAIGLSSSGSGVFQGDGGTPVYLDPNGSLTVDGSASTVNDLRTAFALQRLEEARARYGSRYTEYLRYLGVTSSDARLQRPEYLGGGRQTVQFSEILQTGPESAGGGVGNLKGHGIGAMRTARYRRYFEEHGLVISLLSFRPRSIYAQGLHKMWTRQVKEDFHTRELENVGQQPVLNQELYAAHTSPEGVFGYQNRYEEYRRGVSSVHGEFRDTLDYWHMARIFASDPTLNTAFLNCVPTTRIYASTSTDEVQVMANHSIQARRLVGHGNKSSVF